MSGMPKSPKDMTQAEYSKYGARVGDYFLYLALNLKLISERTSDEIHMERLKDFAWNYYVQKEESRIQMGER